MTTPQENNEPKKKHAGGRPRREFKPEWCDKLIKHMAKGYSFESFAALVDAWSDQLYLWIERYPEFYEAKKRGEAKSRLTWETMGFDGAKGKIPGFNSGTWIFNMKNRFHWKDVHEFSGADGKPISAITFTIVSKNGKNGELHPEVKLPSDNGS